MRDATPMYIASDGAIMAEKIDDLMSDLEKWRSYEKPMYRSLKEAGLSFEAEMVVEKLKTAHPTDGWHRVYRRNKGEMTLVDVLTDRDIAARGYVATDEEAVRLRGNSPAQRDTVRHHKTTKALYQDVWIGETLE
jgi:hypothetical protein